MAKKFLTPIDMNNLEIKNFRVHNASNTNGSPTGMTVTSDKPGELWYDSTNNILKYWTGTAWVPLTADTDTHHTSKNITTNSSTSTTQTTSALTNGNVYLNHVENGSVRSSHKISGSGRATVATDSSGNIVVNSAAYSAATTSADGLMSSTDKTKLNGIATGAEVNVQSDWNQTTTTADDYIKNKPTLGAAAAKDVDTTIGSSTVSDKLPTTNAVKEYVSTQVGAVDAMRFKGTVGDGGNPGTLPTSGVKVGDTYRVITAGTYAGQTCEIGDLIIATATTPTWTVAQTNIDGAITSISGTSPISVTGSGASRTVAISPATHAEAGSMSGEDKNKLDGIAAGAEVNQNAFSNVTVGSTTIAADSKTDTLTLVAGSNVTLTPDATNDKVTIAATDTKNTAGSTDSSSKLFLIGATSQAANPQTYSHDTAYVGTDGCLYSGGAKVLTAHRTYTAVTGKPTANQAPSWSEPSFTISQISQSTTGQITATDRTITIPNATATVITNGLMSSTDKSKLDTMSAMHHYTARITTGQTQTTIDEPSDNSYLLSYAAYLETSKEFVEIDAKYASGTYTFSIASAIAEPILITTIFNVF